MAVCRKSSDATNVRWGPYASGPGSGQGQSPRMFNRLRDVRGSYRAVPVASYLGVDGRPAQGRRPAIRAVRPALRRARPAVGSGAAGHVELRVRRAIWSASSSAANSSWRASDKRAEPGERLAALGVDQRARRCADVSSSPSRQATCSGGRRWSGRPRPSSASAVSDQPVELGDRARDLGAQACSSLAARASSALASARSIRASALLGARSMASFQGRIAPWIRWRSMMKWREQAAQG